MGRSCAAPYPTRHPHAGWAEQRPTDWWEALGRAVRGAVATVQDEEDASRDDRTIEICGLCVDTTCCSVVALDAQHQPLRDCLLWMDQRSAPQTTRVLATRDAALAVNGNGQGPVSAEWMTPKALWMRDHEHDTVWKKAATICEYQDYINYRLTNTTMTASSCNAATRWHWDGIECLKAATAEHPHPGRPLQLYQSLGIPELADKLPSRCLPMGALVGGLTAQAAQHLGGGLPVNLPVLQGGPDAFVGMIGLGCVRPGQLCLITGSSHLHCVVTSQAATTAPGIWGPYRGAPLPHINFAEGGQSSTGSVLRWARRLLGGKDDDNGDADQQHLNYKILDQEAAAVAPGSDGLVALTTFQGSRTPVTDPLARGALLGLTLSHTRGHLWRALLEGVCFGTRACIEGLERAGHPCREIVLAGGVARSDLWLQMHADVTNKTVVVCENSEQAPLLGCAILAAVGCGIHSSVEEACQRMVRPARRIEPDPVAAARYAVLYEQVYAPVADAVRPVAHAIHHLRCGASSSSSSKPPVLEPSSSSPPSTATPVRTGRGLELDDQTTKTTMAARIRRTISPSLLACDWAVMRDEVHRCMDAGLRRFHVDIFDGVFLDSPNALTFGPQMVEAIKRSCDSFPSDHDHANHQHRASLDLHMCVVRPSRFVETMAALGVDCFIFQWEAMRDLTEAKELAVRIVESGLECGVSINPATRVDELFPLLEAGTVSVVDVLAVEPGFGGQTFQNSVLQKIQTLRSWRDDVQSTFAIMVDGGVNKSTAAQILDAGADILVAGTYLFRHSDGIGKGAGVLLGL